LHATGNARPGRYTPQVTAGHHDHNGHQYKEASKKAEPEIKTAKAERTVKPDFQSSPRLHKKRTLYLVFILAMMEIPLPLSVPHSSRTRP
jgi:hypothetical protein